MQTEIVQQFDDLVSKGLQIIPVRSNSKIPMQKAWTKWDQGLCRETLQRYPDANIGILLGDIIDVEGDSEHANNMLLDIIGKYPHPCYTSSRSVHHLFRNPDPKLRILRHQNIEFRGFRHQSVLPPSHHQGISYSWLNCEFPVPEMPKRLLKFYSSLKGSGKCRKKGYVCVWCGNCESKHFVHHKRFSKELKIFKSLHSKWLCQKCREIDLRPLCRQFTKYKGE